MRLTTTTSSQATLEAVVESSAGTVASATAGGMGEGAAAAATSSTKNTNKTSSTTTATQSTTPSILQQSKPIYKRVQFPPSQPPPKPLSAIEWSKKIVAIKGPLGLYSGYRYHLIRDFTGTGLYFLGYESLKVFFTRPGEVPGPLIHMLAGGVSGTMSWVVLYPIDLVKSVMQKGALDKTPKYTSAITFIKKRYSKGGIGGFYHGIGAQLTRSFPVHALNFLVYEQVLKWCRGEVGELVR
ncbi:hypothetical protein HDU76_004493 [Blyttiomyces sp. JEL0837]|nr:hypothetical protein HDU76_004493 [Blyttiomyces sp. JEL0837]